MIHDALSNRLSSFERYPLLDSETPIHALSRLMAAGSFDGVNLFAKRDDLMGVGGGGNKLRKLEFLLGDALAQGCDTLISFGGRQSNYARLSAAAAARAGLRCEVVLTPSAARNDADFQHNGNVLLDGIFGANVHLLAMGQDPQAFVDELARSLARQGRKAYVAPLAGSSALGCLGYVSAAVEIQQQSALTGLDFAAILLPNGSGGSHAGLVAGQVAMGLDPTRVRGYTVLAEKSRAHAITLGKAQDTLALIAPDKSVQASDIVIDGNHLGEGYGVPTAGMLSTVRRVARSEGWLLDPVYGGKALAGVLHDIEQGCYQPGDNLLFLMTGGIPGLFAYRSAFD
ncbi:D-cysteine desulfhydrase family protein [Pseudomonas sp. NA-150]|uniref:D-cysteine desulfhydrase family protein n=1 Tax=Pseudomonas sp. NA-150 TaxID=3367525 RepID=UPI0037CA5B07